MEIINRSFLIYYTDYEAAFISVNQDKLLETRTEYCLDSRYIAILKYIYFQVIASANARGETERCTLTKRHFSKDFPYSSKS